MHDQLRLCNQLCFPLYTISKEITRRYTPFLQELDLTYPQYLVMLVLWESDAMSVGEIGEQLHLDSGTLTPLLKRLQSKGLIDRVRCVNEERSVKITLTEQGQAMENQAVAIPYKMAEQLNLSDDEVDTLKKIVSKLNS